MYFIILQQAAVLVTVVVGGVVGNSSGSSGTPYSISSTLCLTLYKCLKDVSREFDESRVNSHICKRCVVGPCNILCG